MRLLTRVYGVEGVGLPLYYCSQNMFEEQLTNSKKIFYKQHSTRYMYVYHKISSCYHDNKKKSF